MNKQKLPDLTLIEPYRRPKVLARINAIEQFKKAPSRTNAGRWAALVGLRTSQFYRLVSAWETYRDPTKLAGGAMPHGRKVGKRMPTTAGRRSREKPPPSAHRHNQP